VPDRYVTIYLKGCSVGAVGSGRANYANSPEREAQGPAKQPVRSLGGAKVRVQRCDSRRGDTLPPGKDPNRSQNNVRLNGSRIDLSRSRSKQLNQMSPSPQKKSWKTNSSPRREIRFRLDRPVV
jgi:hypothetical protein